MSDIFLVPCCDVFPYIGHLRPLQFWLFFEFEKHRESDVGPVPIKINEVLAFSIADQITHLFVWLTIKDTNGVTICPVWLDIFLYISYILVIVFSRTLCLWVVTSLALTLVIDWSYYQIPRLDGLQSPGMILADCLWNKTKIRVLCIIIVIEL